MLQLALLLFGCPQDAEIVDNTGEIFGTVTLSDGGSAAGTLVAVDGEVAVAAEDGTYRLTDLTAGEHEAWAVLDGYERQVQAVSVGDGATTLDFTLTRVNAAPWVSWLLAQPSEVAPGGEATLAASAQDPDGDTLTWTWTVSDAAWTVTPGQAGAATLTAPSEAGASARVVVTVSDGAATAEAAIAVSTASATGPRIHSVTALPPLVDRAGSAELRVDSDGSAFAWTIDGAGWTLRDDDLAEVVVDAPDASGSTALATVTVDGSAMGSVALATRPNQGPRIEWMLATPATFAPGTSGSLVAGATDPEGDDLEYTWEISDEGWSIAEGLPGTASVDAPDAPGSSAIVTLEVSDGEHVVWSALVVSTAANGAPIVQALTASPPAVARGGTIDLEVTAEDPEGGALSYAWSAGDWSHPDVDSPTITLTAPDEAGASTRVTVTVTDEDDAASTAAIVVATFRNGAPAIASVVVTPGDEISAGGEGTARVFASDPDGDALEFAWAVDGDGWSVVADGATASVAAPDDCAQAALVRVTVSDGDASVEGAVAVRTPRCPPSVHVFASSSAKKVFHLDKDGEPVWTYTGFPGFVVGLTTDADGNVYAGGDDGTIRKIDRDGEVVWTYSVGSEWIQDIEIGPSGEVVAALRQTGVIKLTEAGAFAWKNSASGQTWDVAVGPDGSVYLVSNAAQIRKLGAATGAFVWDYAMGDRALGVATDAAGNVYAGDLAGTLHKVSPAGAKVWSYDGHTPTTLYDVFVAPSGLVYSLASSEVHLLEASGAFVAGFPVHAARRIVVDAAGNFYTASESDGSTRMYTQDGVEVWQYDTPNNMFDVAIYEGE